jgi:glycosyltransferase involved in cell wall biosynthesis
VTLDVLDPEWDVTVVTPTIPTRERRLLLERALASVNAQTRPPVAASIALDLRREGAWATRDRALRAVDPGVSPWVAFLDDDDEFKPEHLERCLQHAAETGADYVFSWFDTRYCYRREDPLGHFGRAFDAADPHHTTVTTVVRTELAQLVGYTPPDPGDRVGGEDWRFTLDCVAAGAKISHLPERTWFWHHDRGGATAGLPTRWVPSV